MATIVQRPSKNGRAGYRVQVRRKGSPPQSASFQTLAEARKWAKICEGAVLEGRHFPSTAAKRHTVSDLIDKYISVVLPGKRASTAYNQNYQLAWWKKQLGHYRLTDVTPALLIDYRDKRVRNTDKRPSGVTVKRWLAVLSHCFTMAVQEWQWCDENPVLKITKPRERRGRVRYLSDEERHQLLEACQDSRNPYLYIIVMLALATGARRGELLRLCWPDVDLKRGTLTFHETKNGDRRAVPLTGQALTLMHQHAKVRRLDTALVFPDATGKRALGIREAFEGAVERAGIKDFRFHDLRHTFASYLAMNGATLAEIAETLGHKTLAMVKRYAHLTEAHTRSVVERMNRAVFGV
jgi:integrase